MPCVYLSLLLIRTVDDLEMLSEVLFPDIGILKVIMSEVMYLYELTYNYETQKCHMCHFASIQ